MSPGWGGRHHPRRDVDGDAADVAVAQLDLAGVQPARMARPMPASSSRSAAAQRTARPGPSKVARMGGATVSPHTMQVPRPRKLCGASGIHQPPCRRDRASGRPRSSVLPAAVDPSLRLGSISRATML
jgi:hypothetical protein